jgi:hypothetical protein
VAPYHNDDKETHARVLLSQGQGVGVLKGLGVGQSFGLEVGDGIVVGVSVAVPVAGGLTVGDAPAGTVDDALGEETTRVKKAARSTVTLHGGTPWGP